ncbi:putative peroxiredoxin bcp [Gammaproteobacteria bacterium]
MSTPILGQPAPDFALPATGTKTVRLTDLHGRQVVLYFYPRDNTTGCTQEAQDFRDHASKFEAMNVVVLGVSRDSQRVHEGFRAKYNLPFDLLADTDSTLCHAYDVIRTKNMYGKIVLGIERSTFLIDQEGILQREWRKVKVKNHVQEVLKALGAEV